MSSHIWHLAKCILCEFKIMILCFLIDTDSEVHAGEINSTKHFTYVAIIFTMESEEFPLKNVLEVKRKEKGFLRINCDKHVLPNTQNKNNE